MTLVESGSPVGGLSVLHRPHSWDWLKTRPLADVTVGRHQSALEGAVEPVCLRTDMLLHMHLPRSCHYSRPCRLTEHFRLPGPGRAGAISGTLSLDESSLSLAASSQALADLLARTHRPNTFLGPVNVWRSLWPLA